MEQEDTIRRILNEFGLDFRDAHIVNGHVPVEQIHGESPIKCGGKLLIIDGGFSKAYQKKTGIAGYTLVSNSHQMYLSEHEPFTSLQESIYNNLDMHSRMIPVKTYPNRVKIADTDDGCEIAAQIADLEKLLEAYRTGAIKHGKA